MLKTNRIHLLLLWLLLSAISVQTVQAQGLVLIRDAEIEDTLAAYAAPIFKAAGLPQEAVSIHIVQDPSLNAFVTGGMQLFVHTGLIQYSDDPTVLMGVFAHEIGHITGGHVMRRKEAMEQNTVGAAIGYVLGAASIAAGAPQAGAAILSGSSHVATRNVLKHSRVHEQSADQAGLNYLQQAGISARGLLALLKTLNQREILYAAEIDPYAITHPLSQERMQHIEQTVATENLPALSDTVITRHKMLVAKLDGFLGEPRKTLEKYPAEGEPSGHYARAVAYHRMGNLAEALREIAALEATVSNDAYLHELKGQILFEHGKIQESIAAYESAVALKPDAPLLRLGLAQAQIASDDASLLNQAAQRLEKVVLTDSRNITAWHLLATAYGKSGKLAESYLALAEKSFLIGDLAETQKFIALSEREYGTEGKAPQRLVDLKSAVQQSENKK